MAGEDQHHLYERITGLFAGWLPGFGILATLH
jgi:hypothetical protein